MPGATLQLTAYGAQDIYLTGNPQITYFKFIYRRHSNFSIESVNIYDDYTTNSTSKIITKIPLNGDLLSSIFLEITMNTTGIENTYYGYQLIDYVDFTMGSQLIDRQYGEWMAIWCDLTYPIDKLQMLDDMLYSTNDKIYVPLQFWFCRNPGLAIPLIALQYSECYLTINFKDKSKVYGNSTISSLKIYADYYYLDTDERRLFMNNSHQYLIDQIQLYESKNIQTTDTKCDLDFTFFHPIKELIWVIQDTSDNSIYNIENFEKCKSAVLQFNGQDRFSIRDGSYFTKVQRFQYHTSSGSNSGYPYIHVYSFALKPEEHQPSGSCNFSRLDNTLLTLNLDTTTLVSSSAYRLIRLYGINYNVLRITNGMGGLAYTS